MPTLTLIALICALPVMVWTLYRLQKQQQLAEWAFYDRINEGINYAREGHYKHLDVIMAQMPQMTKGLDIFVTRISKFSEYSSKQKINALPFTLTKIAAYSSILLGMAIAYFLMPVLQNKTMSDFGAVALNYSTYLLLAMEAGCILFNVAMNGHEYGVNDYTKQVAAAKAAHKAHKGKDNSHYALQYRLLWINMYYELSQLIATKNTGGRDWFVWLAFHMEFPNRTLMRQDMVATAFLVQLAYIEAAHRLNKVMGTEEIEPCVFIREYAKRAKSEDKLDTLLFGTLPDEEMIRNRVAAMLSRP